MPGRAQRLTATEVEKLLARHGFELVSQRGSHRKWRCAASGSQVIVPVHAGRPLPIGTLRNILLNADIPDEEWHD